MYHLLMGYIGDSASPEYIYGDIVLLRQGAGPCPVCNHPTGDCATADSAPNHIWGLTEIPSLLNTNMVLVEEDIYEYRQITPFTKSKVVIAKAGQYVSALRAQELGII